MEDYLLIVDGSGLLSTQYYGNLPREVLMAKSREEQERNYHKIMQTPSGIYTNGIYGFLRTLFKILETMPPKYLAVCWDLTRDTFRREMYPAYKANRSDTPAPLKSQFELCENILQRIGIKQFMDTRFEADDFSGSLCEKFSSEIPIRILTKDHDYLQLVNERVHVFLMQASQTKADELFKKNGLMKSDCPEKCFLMTPETVLSEEGVKPQSIADLKGLQGDASDNIKGVPGIGPKTAVALISRFGSVADLYQSIHEKDEAEFLDLLKSAGLRGSVLKTLTKEEDGISAEESAKLSTVLATIKTDIPISESLSDLALSIDTEETERVLSELSITSLQVPVIRGAAATKKEITFQTVTVADFTEAEQLQKRLLASKRQSWCFIRKPDAFILPLPIRFTGFVRMDFS